MIANGNRTLNINPKEIFLIHSVVSLGLLEFKQEGNALYRPMAYCLDCPDIWYINIIISNPGTPVQT